MAMRRRSSMLQAAWPVRRLQRSSGNVSFITKCKQFSHLEGSCQWPRGASECWVCLDRTVPRIRTHAPPDRPATNPAVARRPGTGGPVPIHVPLWILWHT